jgi:hypothetical protein
VPLSGQHPGGSEHIVIELQGGAHLMTSHQASILVGHTNASVVLTLALWSSQADPMALIKLGGREYGGWSRRWRRVSGDLSMGRPSNP